jgi:hypothetical protein
MSHVEVIIDGKAVFDADCAPHDVVFVIRNGRISLVAGPGAFGSIWTGYLAEQIRP